MIYRRSAAGLVAVIVFAALLSGCEFATATGETRNETVSFDLDDAKSARVDLRMGSGELRVDQRNSQVDGREVRV